MLRSTAPRYGCHSTASSTFSLIALASRSLVRTAVVAPGWTGGGVRLPCPACMGSEGGPPGGPPRASRSSPGNRPGLGLSCELLGDLSRLASFSTMRRAARGSQAEGAVSRSWQSFHPFRSAHPCLFHFGPPPREGEARLPTLKGRQTRPPDGPDPAPPPSPATPRRFVASVSSRTAVAPCASQRSGVSSRRERGRGRSGSRDAPRSAALVLGIVPSGDLSAEIGRVAFDSFLLDGGGDGVVSLPAANATHTETII
jgi:hypothetical protein